MADDNGVDAVPGFDSREQSDPGLRRHGLINSVVVTKQWIEHDLGLTALDHGAHIGDVNRARRRILGGSRQWQEAAKKQTGYKSNHGAYGQARAGRVHADALLVLLREVRCAHAQQRQIDTSTKC